MTLTVLHSLLSALRKEWERISSMLARFEWLRRRQLQRKLVKWSENLSLMILL